MNNKNSICALGKHKAMQKCTDFAIIEEEKCVCVEGFAMGKLDWLLRECVRVAMQEPDGVNAPVFYEVARQVWHHVTHEQPYSANRRENVVIWQIKQYALGFRRTAGYRHGARQLQRPMYPDATYINKQIENYKNKRTVK
jgi:hypothetical protein